MSATLPEGALKALMRASFQIKLHRSDVISYPVTRENMTLLNIETIRACMFVAH